MQQKVGLLNERYEAELSADAEDIALGIAGQFKEILDTEQIKDPQQFDRILTALMFMFHGSV